MQVDEAALSQKYNIVKLSVIGSTQISNRVTAVIAQLEATNANGKPALVCLTSKARTASKLISIVEIAKRDLAAKGINCFQYNALSSELIEIEREPKKAVNGARQTSTKENESDSDDAFQTMGALQSGVKKRNIPVMTTYLSASSVKELKNAYEYDIRMLLYTVQMLTPLSENRLEETESSLRLWISNKCF